MEAITRNVQRPDDRTVYLTLQAIPDAIKALQLPDDAPILADGLLTALEGLGHTAAAARWAVADAVHRKLLSPCETLPVATMPLPTNGSARRFGPPAIPPVTPPGSPPLAFRACPDMAGRLKMMRPRPTFSIDYTSCSWGELTFEFTKKQARVVEALDKAMRRNTPGIHGSSLLDESGYQEKGGRTGARLRDLFKGHPAWGILIVPSKTKGAFRMAQ